MTAEEQIEARRKYDREWKKAHPPTREQQDNLNIKAKQRYHANEEAKKLKADYQRSRKKQHDISQRKSVAKSTSWFRAFKSTLICLRCGDDDWRVLDFHHRDPGTKVAGVATLVRRAVKNVTKEKILAEIAKCDPICANCHAKEHHPVQMYSKFDIRNEYYINSVHFSEKLTKIEQPEIPNTN